MQQIAQSTKGGWYRGGELSCVKYTIPKFLDNGSVFFHAAHRQYVQW